MLGRRPDGYHDIETIFQAIGIYDELLIAERGSGVTLSVPGRPGLENEANLVVRAVRRLEEKTGGSFNLSVELTKRIPTAAGLGGGSSNAAAALAGVNALLDLGLSADELAAEAARLGADVPFFLIGGTAIGEGVGERLTCVRGRLDYELILINPGFPVSTKAVYSEFGRTLTREARSGTVRERSAACSGPAELLHNDLQPITERLYPEVSELTRALDRVGVGANLMSGSGPTVFGLVESGGEGGRMIVALGRRWETLVAGPIAGGVTID